MSSDPAIGSSLSPPLTGGIDLHCHVLPGVDDGPETVEQAVALCRLLSREGVQVAVATPHQLGRYEAVNTAAQIRRAVAEMREHLRRFHVKLEVCVGGEVRLDERIPRLLQDDRILTLGDGGKYLLLELPTGLAFEVSAVLDRVTVPGLRIVLAHAERYDFLRAAGAAERWRDAGVILQINGSSLVGGWSPAAEAAGWDLLARGVATVVASDAHSIGHRRPRWSDSAAAIRRRLGDPALQLLCVENPRRILDGAPLP